jgi:hypothetical protein
MVGMLAMPAPKGPRFETRSRHLTAFLLRNNSLPLPSTRRENQARRPRPHWEVRSHGRVADTFRRRVAIRWPCLCRCPRSRFLQLAKSLSFDDCAAYGFADRRAQRGAFGSPVSNGSVCLTHSRACRCRRATRESEPLAVPGAPRIRSHRPRRRRHGDRRGQEDLQRHRAGGLRRAWAAP